MIESELERLIIVTDDDYPNLEAKLNFINSRLGHYTKNPADENKFLIKPGHHNQVIKKSKYYEVRAKLELQDKKRAKSVTRGRLRTLLNMKVKLNSLHPDIRKGMVKAGDDGKYGALNSLISTKAQLYAAEARIDELIDHITTDPNHIAKEYELMKEDVENLNERINLFTDRY